MKKLVSKIASAALACALVFSFASCGDNGLTGWKTVAKSASDGTALQYVSKVQVSQSSTVGVCEVWYNVSEISGEVTFSLDFLSYSSSVKKIDVKVDNDALKKSKDGWLMLNQTDEIKCNRVLISTCDTMSFNEIVFVGKDGKLLDATFYEGGVRPNGSVSGNIYSSESALDALDESNPAYSKYPAYNVVGEKDKFPTDLIVYKPTEE